ncbi:flagellar hook-associated protein FlgK [Eionea flava]
MTSDILGVSISGLRVSQNALRTVGHNISNANTEGYTRQATDITSLGGTQGGVGFLGNGAYTSNIERVVNEFVTSQVRQDTSLHSELNIYNQNISQLNDLLANESTGLSTGIQSFFSAMQTASDSPTSLASRQLVVSEADNLTDRFSTLASRVNSINDGVIQSIEAAVSNINNLTTEIANLNNKITEFSGASGSPNDLLDQRDSALLKLSALVSVSISQQDDDQVNVTVGNGIPLVLGSQSTSIALGQNEFDPEKPEILLSSSTISQSVTSAFSGGEIGGLLDFQNTVINPTYNEIGRIALVIADNFNELQQQGITLNNNYGSNIFTDINDATAARGRILGNENNGNTTPDILVEINNSSQLTTSDYQLTISNDAGVYSITRLSDNTNVASNIVPTEFPATINFDGIDLVITSSGFSDGDQFLIQPTKFAAQNFSTTGIDANDVALAIPFETQSHIGNVGNASISAGEMLSMDSASGEALALFSQVGQMSPPLIVKFTTSTTYDILDNSDPGNPVDLSPPMRNQTYTPGIQNSLFSSDSGATLVTSLGSAIGLPAGSTQATQAALKPSSTAPIFSGIDFSNTANQFSFDLVVEGTPAGTSDGTFTINIDSAAITDSNSLLAAINDDLSMAGSQVRAYITDTDEGGSIAFASSEHGVGDITVQNYNADPDGNLDVALAGQANALLGFDIESSTFTTVANANGISGIGNTTNSYPVETLTIVTTDDVTGITNSQNIFTSADASARTTASQLSNLTGVTANAFNTMELRASSLSISESVQLSLNGENLIDYDAGVVASSVPSSSLNNGEDFNDYLANEINANANLQALGIRATSRFDAASNEYYVDIQSKFGDDFTVELTSSATGGGSISINDGINADVVMTGSGSSTTTQAVIGGKIDVTLDNNVSFSTTPGTSEIFGDSSATNFSQTAYLGIQASISGTPESGDYFTLNFNTNAASDNRNGVSMVGLQQAGSINGGEQSFQQNYNQLIESIGISANSSQNNTEAAANVLEQTTSLRDSISGVNLDEEAADLIRYEQLYSANAQVISVARDLFDRLLSSF